jgi:hypothetical protein
MKQMSSISYTVTENNGGGIALAVKDNDKYIYIHTGYEGLGNQLAEDVRAILNGEHPIDDGWDGNELDEMRESITEYLTERAERNNEEPMSEDEIDAEIEERLDEDLWRDDPNGGQQIIAQDGEIYFDAAGNNGTEALVYFITDDPQIKLADDYCWRVVVDPDNYGSDPLLVIKHVDNTDGTVWVYEPHAERLVSLLTGGVPMHVRYPWDKSAYDYEYIPGNPDEIDSDREDDPWNDYRAIIEQGKILDTEDIKILLNDVYELLIA